MVREKLLRPKEAAEALGVSTQSIVNWSHNGKIKVLRTPGGHRRVPESEVDRLLSSVPEKRK